MGKDEDNSEREKSTRENLGKFFYDLAKATFTIMVLTNTLALFTSDNYVFALIVFVVGMLTTAVLARIGYSIFKR